MIESVREYIGKMCIVYTAGGEQVAGTVTQVGEGWLELDNKGSREIINLDYTVRIREYPKGKNGKNKSVVID